MDISKLQKESKEAEKKLLSTKWKTTTCSQGASCWCRMIIPVKKIEYSEGEDMIVANSGDISKTVAQYIVKLHNEKLNNNGKSNRTK